MTKHTFLIFYYNNSEKRGVFESHVPNPGNTHLYMNAYPKVVLPILLYWPTVSEMGVGSRG